MASLNLPAPFNIAVWLLLSTLGGAGAQQQPPGIRVDIGGYSLHIHCLGRGRPVVILDAGLGGSAHDWERLQNELAPVTRVCVYDRAGYGCSDPGPLPRTSSRIVSAELHGLLEGATIPPPYLLVGHSFGGYNMRLYASRYPQEVSGLVLVDAPHEAQVDDLLHSPVLRQIDPKGLLPLLWRQVLGDFAAAELEPMAAMLGLPSKTLRAVLGELAAFEQSSAELKTAELRPELPLVVIVHGRRVSAGAPFGEQWEERWIELQRDLAASHQNSTLLIAKDSAHAIPLDQPELIGMAIRRLLAGQRQGN
jgi:pimeloyl-ACP methyl ester carboxylesterase